jgi:hypothetical protein
MRDWWFTCDVCGRKRREQDIGVHKIDIGQQLGIVEAGIYTRNVKYCLDHQDCFTGAKNWNENDHRSNRRES